MVKDLGPVTSKDVEQLAHEPFPVVSQMPLTGPGLRYLDVGFHSFVPQSFQYRLDILQDSAQHGQGVSAGESLQLGARNVKGSEQTWKQRLDNYQSWRQIATGGVPQGQAMVLPAIPVPNVSPEDLTDGVGYPGGDATSAAADAAQLVSDEMKKGNIYKPFNASYWGELMSEFIFAELHNEMMKDPDYKAFYQTNRPEIIQQLIKGPGGQSIDMGPYNEQHVKSLLAEIYLFRQSKVFGDDTEKLLGTEFFHGTEETNLITGKYFQDEFKRMTGKQGKNMGFPEALSTLEDIVKDFTDTFKTHLKILADVQDLANVALEDFYTTEKTKKGISQSSTPGGLPFGKFGPEIVDRIVEIARTRVHNNVPLKGYWLYAFPLNYGSGPRGTGGLAVVRIEPIYAKHDRKAYISDLKTTTGIIPMGQHHVATLYQFGVNMAISEGYISTSLLTEWKQLLYADVGAHIHLQAGRGIVLGQILDDAAFAYMAHTSPFVGLKRIMTKGDIAKSLMDQIKDYAEKALTPAVQKIYDDMVKSSHSLTKLWREASLGNDLEVQSGQSYTTAQNQNMIGIWNRGNFAQVKNSSGISSPFIMHLTGKSDELPVTDDYAAIMGGTAGKPMQAGALEDIKTKRSVLRQLGPLGMDVIKARGFEISEEAMMRSMDDPKDRDEAYWRKQIINEFYKDPHGKISSWGPSLQSDITDAGERYRGLVMDDKGSAVMAKEWQALRKSQGRTWAGMQSGIPTKKMYKSEWEKYATWQPKVDPTSGLTREEYDEARDWELWELDQSDKKKKKN